jgi:uncharacterized damage-inducible protein DinB
MRDFDIPPVEGYDPEVGLLISVMQDATREWRKEIVGLPKSAITWQETPTGVSIGSLMLHMIEAELWWIGEVIGGIPVSQEDVERFRLAEIDQYEDTWPVPLDLDLEGYFALMDGVRDRTLTLLKDAGPSTRIVKRPDKDNGYSIRWILSHLAQHESYHGGQAVLLMKRWQRA